MGRPAGSSATGGAAAKAAGPVVLNGTVVGTASAMTSPLALPDGAGSGATLPLHPPSAVDSISVAISGAVARKREMVRDIIGVSFSNTAVPDECASTGFGPNHFDPERRNAPVKVTLC